MGNQGTVVQFCALLLSPLNIQLRLAEDSDMTYSGLPLRSTLYRVLRTDGESWGGGGKEKERGRGWIGASCLKLLRQSIPVWNCS